MKTPTLAQFKRDPKKAIIALVIVAVIALVGFLAAEYTDTSTSAADGTAPIQFQLTADEVATAEKELASIEVKPKVSMDGYTGNRTTLFGPAWTDSAAGVALAGNGCDTRNDILQRDLVDIELDSDGCTVLSGTLLTDPYTGNKIDFVRGKKTSSKVQIDHIVALGNAWATGAQDMSQEDRVRFANDPINLVAGDGPANGSKGDKDPSEWMPEYEPIHCFYAASVIRVKAKYEELWVTQEEHDALASAIAKCPGV